MAAELALVLPPLLPPVGAEEETRKPLLSDLDLAPFWPQARAAALELLPLLRAMPALAPSLEEARNFLSLERDEAETRALLSASLAQDLAGLEALGASPASSLALELGLSALLRALVPGLEASKVRWPFWLKGICPVCGRPPVLDWLAKGQTDERNPQLLGGGGKKHLRCGLCGCDWVFRRAVCPVCGSEEKGVINLLYDRGRRSEHLAFCSSCQRYVVGVDLRNPSPEPDLDLMCLGLLPLDLVGRERGLSPACPSPWNQF